MRRLVAPEADSYKEHLFDRLGGHVEVLDSLVFPSAAELVARAFPGDGEAADAAISVVDGHTRKLRALLGCERGAA